MDLVLGPGELDLKYQPSEGGTGVWAQEDFGAPIQDR